jgi:pimeloyl-ACP methyl ester carboxylesterase
MSMMTVSTLLAGILSGTPASAAPEVRCTETMLPVMVALLPQTVHGKLCVPVGSTPKTVQLLVHGGTYNSQYWDLPFDSGRYSYQRDMAARGYATFAMDCLGSGGSSQPLSALITGTTQASVVHQVIGKLRAGKVGGTRFDKIVSVGHSMGSGITAMEASTYRDVDGVIFTGMSHSMDILELTRVFVDGVRPALLDPVLARRGGDPGYITTMPTTRGLFHEPGDVEPGIVDADEATKDQVAATVVADLLPLAFLSPMTRSINVPVLITNGAVDSLFCAFTCGSEEQFKAAEDPYFSPEAQLTVRLLPRAGHAIALAANAPAYRTAVHEWMKTHFAN